MHRPLVSVVMVVCNVDRFLAESIDSILRQTFREFEFIIVDFGSTDKSEAIASSYAEKDSRIKLHKIPHCGLAEARNAGCFRAQGQYIAIMDADDVSLPDRLLWELEFAESHPEVNLLGGAIECIDVKGRSLRIFDVPTEDQEIKSALVTQCPFWQSTVLIRRDAFALVGGYRVIFAQAEDYDLWLRIAEYFQVANLKQVVVKYRIHPYQVSLRKQREQTLCVLAAQVSASFRRSGRQDPFNEIKDITPSVLVGLGVSEATQDRKFANEYRKWIGNMCAAGEHSAALKAVIETLPSSDWKYAEKWQIADMWLTASKLYWREEKFWCSFAAAAHAVKVSPRVLGRPLRLLLRGGLRV
jgi:glycosyltransferase involved in cell wall biosynthesis